MGYKPSRKMYDLVFEDYPGLEVCMYGTTIGRLESLVKLGQNMASATHEQQMSIFSLLTSNLVSWNIEHPELETVRQPDTGDFITPTACILCGAAAGDPLPSTATALKCLELGFVVSIMNGWMQALGGVSGPKAQSFNSGETSTPMPMNRLANLQSPLT